MDEKVLESGWNPSWDDDSDEDSKGQGETEEKVKQEGVGTSQSFMDLDQDKRWSKDSTHVTSQAPRQSQNAGWGSSDNGMFKRKFYSKEELMKGWKANLGNASGNNSNSTSSTPPQSQHCTKCGIKCDDLQKHSCRNQTITNPDSNSEASRVNIGQSLLTNEAKELKCADCGKTFAKNIHLSLHMKIHARMGKTSQESTATFAKEKPSTSTWNHSATDVLKSGLNPVNCSVCGMSFSSNDSLNEHLSSHHRAVLTCLYCGKTFKSADDLRVHAETHDESDRLIKFGCPRCGRRFGRQNQLNFHVKFCKAETSNKETPVIRSSNLIKSTKVVQKESPEAASSYSDKEEEEEKPGYQCPLCGAKFFKEIGLKQHHAKAHRKQILKFSCPHCSRRFKHEHYLKFHLRGHNKSCPKCGRRIPEDNYSNHVEFCAGGSSKVENPTTSKNPPPIKIEIPTSSKNGPSSCDICAKSFSTTIELSQHCLLHAFSTVDYVCSRNNGFESILPFFCEYAECKRRFSDKSDLVYHINQKHLIEDPLCCEVCGRDFSREVNLKSHRSLAHNLDKPREVRDIRENGRKINTSTRNGSNLQKPRLSFYRLQTGPSPPNPYVLLTQDIKALADQLMEKQKQSMNQDRRRICGRNRNGPSALPVILKNRKKKPRGGKVREDIPFQNFYICNICDRRFYKRNYYIIHLAQHNRKAKFECHLCDKKFFVSVALEKHIKRHSEPNYTERYGRAGRVDIPHQDIYTCDQCPETERQTFRDRKKFLLHLWYHKMKSQLKCRQCDRSFITKRMLRSHMKLHSDPNYVGRHRQRRSHIPVQDVYHCQKCEGKRSFTDRQKYIMHLHYHRMKRLQCKFCPKFFTTEKVLHEHMEKHSDPAFENRSRGGRPSSIPIQDVYSCKICPNEKTFTDRMKYLLHIRYHKLEAKFVCPFCSHRFKTEQSFKYHIQSHATEKRFKCDDCLKAFKTEQTLYIHKRLCKKVPCKYKCKTCNDRFHNKLTLARHVENCRSASSANAIQTQLTTPVIEHPCPHCSQTFNTTFGLTRHISVYHPSTDVTVESAGFDAMYFENAANYCNTNPVQRSPSALATEEIIDDDSNNSPAWDDDPNDEDYEPPDMTDMLAVSFCETEMTEDPDQDVPLQKKRGPKSTSSASRRPICTCGINQKYKSQKFCHSLKCPCINAGQRCGSSCRCKDSCLNKSTCEYKQQQIFKEGKEQMIQDEISHLNDSAAPISIVEHAASPVIIHTKAIIGTTKSPITISVSRSQHSHSTSSGSLGLTNVRQSEFISVGGGEVIDESLRQLTMSGYVEGADETDPLFDPPEPDVLQPQPSTSTVTATPFMPKPLSSTLYGGTTTVTEEANLPRTSISYGLGNTMALNNLPPATESGLLRCEFCNNKIFKFMPAYISHVLLHGSDQTTYTCPLCKDCFSPVTSFVQHMDAHNKGVNLQCTRCSSKFKSYNDMDKHIKVHHFRPLECGLCLVKFRDENLIMTHWSKEHPSCQCRFCLVKFFCHEDRTHHEKSLHSPLDCVHCGMRFENLDGLLDHFSQNHYTPSTVSQDYVQEQYYEDDLRCDQCGVTFESLESLSEHLNTHIQENFRGVYNHQQQQPRTETSGWNTTIPQRQPVYGSPSFQAPEENNIQAVEAITCPVCGKADFHSRAGLSQHIRSHNVSLCSACNSVFSSEAELSQHLLTTPCVVYKCNVCHKNFKNRKSLNQHSKFHRDPTGSSNGGPSAIVGSYQRPRPFNDFPSTPVIVASTSLAAPQTHIYAVPKSQQPRQNQGMEIEEITLD